MEGKYIEDGAFIAQTQLAAMGMESLCPPGVVGVYIRRAPTNKATRGQVYDALDSERAYQAERWNRDTTSTAGEHESLADWVIFMEYYLGLAKAALATEPEPQATQKGLHIIRKVAALGVAAMESLGAPVRPFEEFPSYREKKSVQ